MELFPYEEALGGVTYWMEIRLYFCLALGILCPELVTESGQRYHLPGADSAQSYKKATRRELIQTSSSCLMTGYALRGHSLKLDKPIVRLNVRKQFYSYRVIDSLGYTETYRDYRHYRNPSYWPMGGAPCTGGVWSPPVAINNDCLYWLSWGG